jgi:Protein of unknown function (DUF2934)
MLQSSSKIASPLLPTNGVAPISAKHSVEAMSVSPEAIAKRAYQKFLARGGVHGLDREDWMAAHDELIGEAFESHGSGK